MNMYNHPLYQEDILNISKMNLPWTKFSNKTVMITGATGLFGTFLVDVLMRKNIDDGIGCKIICTGRNQERGLQHFARYSNNELFDFCEIDLNLPIDESQFPEKIDFIIHLASNTHPKSYATEPINTITANVIGTYNLLDFGLKHHIKRFAYASSCEIYGENRGDTELFDEKYLGYIDCNTLRAGYTEGKRCGEALCQAFIAEKSMDIVISRFARSYGPTLNKDDSKAMSQFLFNGARREDIILKSAGEQHFSYIYMADAISGLLTIILKGGNGEAYNIADSASDVKLKDLAQLIADYCGTKVVFDLPDAMEAAGFSKATKARLDNHKISSELGWKAIYDIRGGVKRTINILTTINEGERR